MDVEKNGSLVSGCDCGARYLCWTDGSVSKGAPTPWSELADRVHEIPLMNSVDLQYLKDGHLVRFRGAVQDMHNPEFFFENFEIFNKQTKESRIGSGKYRDTSDIGEFEVIDYNSPNLKSSERQTITVITIPAFNSWAKSAENAQNVVSHLVNPPSTSKYQNVDSNTRTKRSLDLAEHCESSNEMETDSVVNPNKERRKSTSVENQMGNISRDHILNFPLPDDDGKVCLVKIYENFDDLKLNEMVEITGYLSVDPALSCHWNGNAQNENEVDPDAEVLTHNPPPSLVPRIHAIHVERLKHCNPLVKQDSAEIVTVNAEKAREHLHKIFTQICLGDSLAADYLICHLISHVHIRQKVLPLGKLTLNLWKVPADRYPEYTVKLYDLIENIVTKSHYLPLTIDNLNSLAFCPKKDYTCNRLTSGILQLTKNTHLVMDETKMQPGQLNNSGVQNLASLGEAILNQTVKYDFKFYTMDYTCDIPFLILSEGKSLLPNDVSLPLVADNSSLEIVNETFEAAKHYLTPEILNEIRIYLTTTQLIDYQITEEPLYVQEDFVSMRKNNTQKKEIDAQDLHRLLILTRLICISKGYKTIDKSCWDMAKNMEEERFSRLS